jgi:threonine synthase
MGTAHPAKFPEAVAEATGEPVVVPPRLAALADLPERYEVVPNDLDAVRAVVRGLG